MMAIKPTLDTRFFIDPVWWEQSDRDLNSTISQIAGEFDVELSEAGEPEFDWIDPDSALVTRVDLFFYTFLRDVASRDDFISERTSMIDSIFRALLKKARQPLTAREIAALAQRPESGVLKMLTGKTIYNGVRRYTITAEG